MGLERLGSLRSVDVGASETVSGHTIAMIPARLGSQRLTNKNLRELGGVPLIARAIQKCIRAEVFDEIWVNSEAVAIGEIAIAEGAQFHRRPPELASHTATSEDFVREFLESHRCDRLIQVHSIAPLLGAGRVAEFVRAFEGSTAETQLSFVPEKIECAIGGRPINFSFDRKTNSQELEPIQRITWSITGWTRRTYLDAAERGQTATYAGKIAWFELDHLEGHIVKTATDLEIAERLIALAERDI